MNVYSLSYCPKCKQLHGGSQLSVHGMDNIDTAHVLVREGTPIHQVYQSFCGWCGNFIKGEKCTCGNTKRQQYSKE